jgi:adenine-specific DNA-methyltransferase
MKLYQTLEQQLKKEPNFVTDNGELKKWVVLNKAQNFDEELIGLLLDNADLEEKFFVNVKGPSASSGQATLVFNQNLFVQFLEQKNYLNDSYTQYKNKVGLTIDGKYLKQRNEVALVWPFKDCILEGGQSREEDKREEIFFNEILAQDEITQLLEPKVLTNAKRIEADTSTDSVQAIEKPLDQFNRNENGTITDNLIIKGNNLLALHTLKEEFSGKVKLIYIDPPYNTGNDGFKYNDGFNRSSWLTFMKNRLEAAKTLLDKEGNIFIQIDDNEGAYLKVLLDDIFGQENFRSRIIWKRTFNSGSSKALSKKLPANNDTIYWYSKSSNFLHNKQYKEYSDGAKKRYDKVDENGIRFKWNPMKTYSKEKLERLIEAGEAMWTETSKYPVYKHYYDENKGTVLDNFWDDISSIGTFSKEREEFVTQKPESLIERIILLSSNEGDIVLDYHLGSGTTCAVSHKMKRQYIGIEQMNYGENDSVKRLSNVINGEQSGVSKAYEWQGSGSFVCLELKKYNQNFIELIEEAKDTNALLQIWEQMKAKSFLNYNVDIKKQDEHLEEFKALSLAEQKQHLCELLDKNQLYVNLSSLNDGDFECTEEEKKVTKDFYQIKK